jgi:hypothetical protein
MTSYEPRVVKRKEKKKKVLRLQKKKKKKRNSIVQVRLSRDGSEQSKNGMTQIQSNQDRQSSNCI